MNIWEKTLCILVVLALLGSGLLTGYIIGRRHGYDDGRMDGYAQSLRELIIRAEGGVK